MRSPLPQIVLCISALLILVGCSSVPGSGSGRLAAGVVPTTGGAMPGHAEDGLIQRGGVQLHYEVEGGGQPVIILSGGPGFDPAYMKSMAAVLPDRFQRVYLHQRGTGRSQIENVSASNMTLELMIEDLEALRRALRQEKVFLFGHSWGGMLAMAYAAAHPKRVDRLSLAIVPA